MKLRMILVIIMSLILMMPMVMFKVEGQARKGQDTRKFGIKEDTNKTSQRRVALVIGNSAYRESPLKNPVNDAQDVAKVLRELGFSVDLKLNTTREVMFKSIQEFGKKIEPNSVALFYYAGHGIQSNGENYLIPIDAEINKEAELPYATVSAGLALAQMEGVKDTLNLVILDACRNNPFERSFRSNSKGLAQMKAPTGTLIAYSTAPGSVASDGSGKNGLYTQEFLKAMRTPGLSVEKVFKEIRKSVITLSNQQQVPWDASSLVGEFYFAGEETKVESIDEEAANWKFIEKRPTKDLLEGYLTDYPKGKYSEVARKMLNKLTVKLVVLPKPSNDTNIEVAENKTIASKFSNTTPLVEPLEPPSSSTGAVEPDPAVDRRMTGEFVRIPAGNFTMGESRKIEIFKDYYNDDERPVHDVVISRSFEMGKYEVTQEQWEAVMGNNPSYFKGDGRLPVEQVSWDDVQKFISALNSRSRKYTYRLPTEAEWEYAARAGSRGDYAGNLDAMGWYKDNSGGKTHAVGGKQANAFGLYDMHGNVYEWCSDWYGNYSSGTLTDPSGANSGSSRVIRGGSFYYDAAYCRSAFRFYESPGYRFSALGFRLLRTSR